MQNDLGPKALIIVNFFIMIADRMLYLAKWLGRMHNVILIIVIVIHSIHNVLVVAHFV